MRYHAEGYTPVQIAKILGITKKTVLLTMEESMERSLARIRASREERFDEDLPPPNPRPIRGEVLDSPETEANRREAFELRRRGLPYAEIADHLGVSRPEASRYVKDYLSSLVDDELADADLARRMQLEQLEEMIRAVHAPATGRRLDGTLGPPILEAMDRMMKLLSQKAKLLGLDAPQKVDIEHRLVLMAEESGYDIEELREIAHDVLRDLNTSGVLGRG